MDDTIPLQSQNPLPVKKGTFNDLLQIIIDHSQGSRPLSEHKTKLILGQVASKTGNQRDFKITGLISNRISETNCEFQFRLEQTEKGIAVFLMNDGQTYVGIAKHLTFDDLPRV